MARYMLGNKLSPELQAEALLAFGNDRFTGQHRPKWLDGPFTGSEQRNGPPHFKDDAQWLAQTEFPVSGNEPKLRLARNGQKPRTHYLRDPLSQAGDAMTAERAEGLAIMVAKQNGSVVWVQVEGQRIGDMTFIRPNTGLPHMWRVVTPNGELY